MASNRSSIVRIPQPLRRENKFRDDRSDAGSRSGSKRSPRARSIAGSTSGSTTGSTSNERPFEAKDILKTTKAKILKLWFELKEKTQNYRYAKITLITGVIIISLIVLTVIILKFFRSSKQGRDEALESFSKNIDLNVRPCNDFYDFACGNINTNLDFKIWSNYYLLNQEKMIKKMAKSFESDKLAKHTELKTFQFAKKLWLMCLNGGSGLDEIFKLKKYLEKLDSLKTLQDKLTRVIKDGYDVLFKIVPVKDPRHPESFILYLDSSFDLYSYYETLTEGKSSRYLFEMLRLLDLAIDEEKVNKIKKLNKYYLLKRHLYPINQQNSPSEYKIISIKQLDSLSDGKIEWELFFNQLVLSNFTREKDVLVNYDFQRYMKRIMNEQFTDVLDIYIKFSVLQYSCMTLGRKCRNIMYKLGKLINIDDNLLIDQINCHNLLKPHLGEIFFRVYLIDEKSIFDEASNITSNIAGELINLITEFSWMDEATKSSSLDKILYQSVEFSHPSWLTNTTNVEEKYSRLPFISSNRTRSLYSYHRGLLKYSRSNVFRLLGEEEITFPSWPISLFQSYSTYDHFDKTMYITGSSLSGYLFDQDFTLEMKYSLLGSMISREMVRKIDPISSLFDEINGEFWSNYTKTNFDDKTKCLFKQLNEFYKLDQGKLNSNSTTISEHFVELAGLKILYMAYRKQSESDMPQDDVAYPASLSELNEEQLFFVFYANTFCGKLNYFDTFTRTYFSFDRKYRLNLALSHLEEFNHAFDCSGKDKMIKKTKCNIW